MFCAVRRSFTPLYRLRGRIPLVYSIHSDRQQSPSLPLPLWDRAFIRTALAPKPKRGAEPLKAGRVYEFTRLQVKALPSLNGCSRVAGGVERIALAVFAGLFALLEQPGGGRFHGPAPINRGHAPCEIRPRNIRSVPSVRLRCTIEAKAIAGPLPCPHACRPGRSVERFRSCDQPQRLQFGRRDNAAVLRRQNFR